MDTPVQKNFFAKKKKKKIKTGIFIHLTIFCKFVETPKVSAKKSYSGLAKGFVFENFEFLQYS